MELAETDRARGQGRLALVVPDDPLAADTDFDRRAEEFHGQRHPLADGHRAGLILDQFEVVAVPPQPHVLRLRVEGDFVAVEVVDAAARLLHADNQPRIRAMTISHEYLDADLAVADRRKFADQPIAGGAGNVQFPTPDPPASAEGMEALDLLRGYDRRLLKTLAKNHLAVDAAVDLMVHVFDTCPGEIGAKRGRWPDRRARRYEPLGRDSLPARQSFLLAHDWR